MKIAIFSDSHDNLANFKKAISLIEKEKIKVIIHCGDIGSSDELMETIKKFQGKIHLVFGNADDPDFLTKLILKKKIKNVILHAKMGEVVKDKKKIAFCHLPKVAYNLALSGKYDLVFFGHTHKPWEEKIGKTKLVNPGNLAGLFYRATFAIYDTKEDKLKLKILS